MKATGWSTFVMQSYLALCEKAGASYALDAFVDQAGAALDSIGYAKGSWVATTLPARLAAIIQRLAESNYPLEVTLIAHKAISLCEDLSASEMRVAAAIVDHFNRDTGQCDPGLESIARLIGLSRRTVNRARGLLRLLDALIDLGDRRSAALEQDEAFRHVQGSVAACP